ncbi:hypothetical protein N9B82_02580 [Saprospiraceae bacterium]|nr:hypothetical protein [Saprospiraceae bacterium]
MADQTTKPTPEAKALSLFFMALKSKSPSFKEKAKRINRRWDLVGLGRITMDDYKEEIQNTLSEFGGYEEVVEKTVRFYIDKFGEWKSTGEDKYSQDAKAIVEKIMKEKEAQKPE